MFNPRWKTLPRLLVCACVCVRDRKPDECLTESSVVQSQVQENETNLVEALFSLHFCLFLSCSLVWTLSIHWLLFPRLIPVILSHGGTFPADVCVCAFVVVL